MSNELPNQESSDGIRRLQGKLTRSLMPELPLPVQDPRLLDGALDDLLDVTGLLAALLIIKQLGHDALREALQPTASDQPPADSFFKALTDTPSHSGTTSEARRYVANVAPLVTSFRERPAFQPALLTVRALEAGTTQERKDVLSLLDERWQAAGTFIGRFTTPPQVADLMLELVGPRPGETIYDPCFGFGEFVVGTARRLHATAGQDCSQAGTDGTRIFGIEIDRVAYAIGLCRALLAGIEHPRLEFGDALHRPRPADGFDCILAAPPWGRTTASSAPADRMASSDTGAEPAAAGREPSSGQLPIRSRDSENLFLQHVMASLRPGGRAVVALPERTLFRGGADRRVREALLSGYRVDAVIALPAAAFASSMSVPVNLVAFTRDEPRAAVRFVRISPRAWDTAPGAGDAGRAGGALQRWLAGVVRGAALAAPAIPDGAEAWEVRERELARRNHELVARTTGTQELAADLERIAAARSVQVEPLEHVAQARAGLSYNRQTTTGLPTTPAVVAGLLRVGDVNDAGIRPPSLFLIGDDERPVNEHDTLRAGDVVVTTSGTVGRVALLSDLPATLDWVAARSLAVIRAREGLTPGFLAALLQSPAYQHWLSGHARGTTIQHLSIRVLRELPIPVPPVQVQDAVLGELGGSRGDALNVLARLLAGRERSPLAAWLETPFVSRLGAGRVGDESDAMENLVAAAGALGSLAARIDHGTELALPAGGDQRAGAWFDAARRAAAVLDGVASIPRGAGRLAVLELGRSRLHEALHTLDAAHDPTANRLRSFTRAMAEMAEEATRTMQESIALGVGVRPAEVVAGIDSEVQLHVTNSSHVPLRKLHVEARLFETGPPDAPGEAQTAFGEGNIDYLAESATHDIPLAVRPGAATRSLRIVASWQARRLNGTGVHGEKQIELRVLPAGKTARLRDPVASPYIVGSPVDRPEMFFGRTDVMARIKRQLGGRAHANVILLEGNRRTGKTSILRQLGKADAPAGWIPVYCSFQDAEGDATRGGIATHNVFRLLARTTGWALHDAGVETWFPELPGRDPGRPFKLAFSAALKQAFAGEHPFETFALYVTAALEVSKPRRILLMLDEFDKLQEGIDAGITSPQVPENLRHLLQHQPGLSAIITGSLRLKRLREEYWSALFGLGHRIGISALPIEEARLLVARPVEGVLDYLPQACDRLVNLCACQPFLVQSLCNRVFEQAAAENRRTVTVDIVDEAADEMVRDNEHFRTLWDYARTERRRLLLLLCDRFAEGPDAVNLDLLRVKLDEFEVPVLRGRDLASDIAELRELELVRLENSRRGGAYRLSVPLMARWLRMNVDFNEAVVRARDEASEAKP